MTDPSSAHNAAILPALRLIIEHSSAESEQWILLETLCLGIGRLHGRNDRETALFIETMAERIVTGERA